MIDENLSYLCSVQDQENKTYYFSVWYFLYPFGSFYSAKYKAVQIPVATAEMCWFSWSRMGGGQPFFYDKFSLTMTKRNENASRVNNSNTTSTFAHETGIFLTADNIERLKNLFSTPENYVKMYILTTTDVHIIIKAQQRCLFNATYRK